MPQLNRYTLSMIKILYLYILFFFTISLFAVESYQVNFSGVSDPEMIRLLEQHSRCVSLQNSPPETNAGLKRRVEADIPDLAKALQSWAFYSPKIDYEIDYKQCPAIVQFLIQPGLEYVFESFEVVPDESECSTFPFECISLEALDIWLEYSALPKTILDAEEKLLVLMESMGYALAQITNREVVADQAKGTIRVKLTVKTGPLCRFGETTVVGNCSVENEFFDKKIAWQDCKTYDPKKVEKTQNALEAAGLFSSINITHAEQVDECGELPMAIEVVEGKHRSVALGVGYTTHWGPGIIAEWENRNIRNIGEKLSFKTNVWQRMQEGTLMYLKPDFCHRNQDLLWLAQMQREDTLAFTDTSFSVSSLIQKQVHEHTRLSYGLMYKFIHDHRTDNNRVYNLMKLPIQVRWSNANSLLDPTNGITTNFKIIPSLQVVNPRFAYSINTFSGATYYSLNDEQSIVLAAKVNLGSIIGAPLHAIPPSERFYAGSDNLLRGYRFMTVAPLRPSHRRPEGGRSLMVYSFETRYRSSDCLGWVLFYDFGNVYRSTFPEFGRIRQSVGVGARYQTPVGPLRFDVAVPLNRRRHIDHTFEVYVSVGQAF